MLYVKFTKVSSQVIVPLWKLKLASDDYEESCPEFVISASEGNINHIIFNKDIEYIGEAEEEGCVKIFENLKKTASREVLKVILKKFPVLEEIEKKKKTKKKTKVVNYIPSIIVA